MVFTFATGTIRSNVSYRFTVYALNLEGESPPSAPFTFTPKAPGPCTISTLTAAGGTLNIVVSPPADFGAAGGKGAAGVAV